MIKALIIKGIDDLFNRLISLDPNLKKKLIPLVGKIIKIEIKDLGFDIYIEATKDRLDISATHRETANLIIRGNSFSLAKLWCKQQLGHHDIPKDIEFSGDTELAQAVNELFTEIDIDWEEQLSKLTGDIMAHQAGNTVRNLFEFGKSTTETLQQNMSEYLQEEIQCFPTRCEINDFLETVDVTRDDIERTELRLARIEKTIN